MISLRKCTPDDCETLRQMQQQAFAALLEKYRDITTNPACETAARIREKMAQPQTTYYFILQNETPVGAVRVFRIDETTMRISPIFVLPEYQSKGAARKAMQLLEQEFNNITSWQLDTIKQETKLCHFYEVQGYQPTGETYDIQDGMTIVFYEKIKNPKNTIHK